MSETLIDGVLLLDKPSGHTSHDMVDFVRRKFGIKKVGHCGTLDPMATGLLMLVIGKATKVQDLLMSEDKEYEGTLTLGVVTDSQDAQGEVLERRSVPELDEEKLHDVFGKFKGDFYQTPPMVSAVKKDGVPLYKLARKGKVVEREPRFVHVYWYKIDKVAIPDVNFSIKCSKGFYVRTYCHEIGDELGCGGHLSRLVRSRSGNFLLENAVGWDALQAMSGIDELAGKVLSMAEVSHIRRQ